MPSQHPIPALDWGTAPHEKGNFVGEGPYSSRMEATTNPVAVPEPTSQSDSEILGATNLAPAVSITGIVNTRPVPTVSGGSRSLNLAAGGMGNASKVSGNDPRRASCILVSAQPFYYANNQGQAEQGMCALIPANTAVTFTHRDEIWIGAPTTNSFPQTIGVIVENWAR